MGLYLGTLVWPLVVILALWMFRVPIATFIQNIRRARAFGGEVETQPLGGQELPELIEASFNKLQEGLVEQIGERLGGREAAEREVASVVESNFLAVDIAPFFDQIIERYLHIPYDAGMTFADLQDRIWPILSGHAEVFSYGVEWELRFVDTGIVIVNQYHNRRIRTNQIGRAQLPDNRTLQELGIRPSRRLILEHITGGLRVYAVGEPTH